jgi:hypothetical protein
MRTKLWIDTRTGRRSLFFMVAVLVAIYVPTLLLLTS